MMNLGAICTFAGLFIITVCISELVVLELIKMNGIHLLFKRCKWN